MTRRRTHTRKGFNLIESAIVLGVVGLIIGGIWVASASVMRNYRTQQTLDGFLFIGEKLNHVYGKSGDGDYAITPQQLHAMLGTAPAGWTFNADDTLDSPIFSELEIWVDYGSFRIYSPVSPTKPVNEADCKSFGTLALKSLNNSKIVNEAWVGGGSYYASGEYYDGVLYALANLDNGFSVSQFRQVDPIWAGGVAGCNHAEMQITRP